MIDTLVVYDTALCNLSCRYCFISKNNSLLEIDNELAKSFEGSYYIDLAKELIGDISQIKRLEIWGGEPTLHMERIFNFLDSLIKESPVLDSIFFSSNFYTTSVLKAIEQLYSFLSKYPDRNFNIRVQVSIDGPTEITDKARGEGVTSNIIQNFDKLIKITPPNNVSLKLHLKPTLDRESMKLFLTKEFIINYYKFFEDNFINKVKQVKNKQIIMTSYAIPNLALPSAHTQQDGFLLAEILRLMREIEHENNINPIFKYYKKITWFARYENKKEQCNYELRGGFCGSGRNMIGLLPHGKSCGCHRSFTDYLENYIKDRKNDVQDKVIMSEELGKVSISGKVLIFNSKYEMKNHISRIGQFYDKSSTSIISNMTVLIRSLAYIGQIDDKYKDEDKAMQGAYDVMNTHAMCINDLISLTGSISMCYTALIKLFLNGAVDYIYQRGESNR